MDDRFQTSLFNDNAEYAAFKEKFKPKKTTDDCYTPKQVYDAVLAWVAAEYKLPPETLITRPFWPESDFMQWDYPDGCVVLDNPPFSLLATIIRWYCARGISFFLFGPALTLFTATEQPVCYLATGADITYENGAVVPTSFVTNMDRMRLRTAPKLRATVMEANARALRDRKTTAELPKYVYPDCVITAAAMQKLSKYGAELNIPPEDAIYTSALDAQREMKKTIFGGGFLLRERAAAERAAAERAAAERAAAERAAAERAAAHVWTLSARERAMLGAGPAESDGLIWD